MSRVNIQSVEEKFLFGSPPLLSGFSCRLEDNYPAYLERCNADACDPSTYDMNRINHSYVNNKQGIRSNPLIGAFNQLSLHGENGLKILEKAGIKVPQQNLYEPVFKKRKDLRTLQNNLSKERYREVVMKFGDGGDEGGKEILESVHTTMKKNKQLHVTCLFCDSQSQVYENFPVVDGTLFVTPLKLSVDCINFNENTSARANDTRYMCYICVKCQEGHSKVFKCNDCETPWNGSFFQIGTLYSYDILSAIPCCRRQFTCKRCHKEVLNENDSTSLFFSHFSKKTSCPHCKYEHFHLIKPLSMFGATKENA